MLYLPNISETSIRCFLYILTEDYITAEKRAGKKFEYKNAQEKYLIDSNRFLDIKAHPIIQEIGIKLVNVEVKSRNSTESISRSNRTDFIDQSYLLF
ncbi:MAG: hypothetical protein NMK33_02730 [Candidatus Cardinium sp.]|uniref:hypothetical protein n=1 Tax=Cardinium endosymbiont of Dermatophagoides farinae TaxID=2597823 RepID=UPI001182D737|nr:hypothetical protein [Cardinium endosymbiont of Dermatophagoides farinae]TSJ81388.1 hypothetical protein FPG78_05405 [Cardinium endosymbiont of Dermatophagoides farinae]UWW97453.1 MAG: hypothetical protein NMK33_02730 [Candidatus Cardinium sp.]